MKNKCRKRRNSFYGILGKVFLMTAILLLNTGFVHALLPSEVLDFEVSQQPFTVKGKVESNKGEILPGVSVVIKGTLIGTMTDADGNFEINVPNEETILEISCIGFKKIEQKIGNKTFLTIILEEDEKLLEEVVVIGYQTVKKNQVHGAVTSLKADDLKGVTAPSIDVMLQGMVPGLNVQVFSGEPGGRNTFTIRGNTEVSNSELTSSPLIVLDGVPVDPSVVGYSASNTNFLSNINPNDIESLDFLKDAAAASIYGSKGANGVLIITTKRGQTGKPRINFNGRIGLVTRPVTPDIHIGNDERRAKLDRMQLYGTVENLEATPQILTDSINPMFNNATNWFDVFYQDALVHDYNLSITGGDALSNYRLGGGYYKEEGTIIGTGFDRYSFNGNVNNKLLNDRLEFQTLVNYTRTSRQPTPGGNPSTNANNMDVSNMPSTLLLLTDIDKNAMLGQYEQSIDHNTDDLISLSEYMTLGLTRDKSLSFNMRAAFSSMNSRRDLSQPSTSNVDRRASASSTSRKVENWNIENFLSYNKVFGDHGFIGLLGQTAESTKEYSNYIYGDYLSSDLIHVVNGVTKDNLTAYSTIQEASMLSYLARLNYFFKGRYSISASVRRDGSSRFGPDMRWGLFPTFSSFWILSDEPFMEKMKNYISLAKFRASWGKAGSLPSGYYGHYNRYQILSSTYDGMTGISPQFSDGIAQKDLSWEETREWNLGLDMDMFRGRFNLTVDIYNKEKHGIFYSFPLAKTAGYDRYYTNAVAVRNAGVEFSLMTRIFPPESKWQWDVRFNSSYNKNTLMRLPDGNRTVVEDYRYLMVGYPLNIFRTSEYLGVFSTLDDIPFNPYTGEIYKAENGRPYVAGSGYYRDVDKDYQYVTYKDRITVGDPNPKWVGGISSNLRYGKWNLMVHASYTLGRDIMNSQLANTLGVTWASWGTDEEGIGFSGGPTANTSNPGTANWYYAEDFVARRMMMNLNKFSFWEKEGDVTDYPSFSQYVSVNNFITRSSMFMENGSYLKLNTIMLSYDFDLKHLGINNLRASLTAENVAILKHRKTHAADPSIVSPDGYYTGNGYGLPRKFTVGLMFDF